MTAAAAVGSRRLNLRWAGSEHGIAVPGYPHADGLCDGGSNQGPLPGPEPTVPRGDPLTTAYARPRRQGPHGEHGPRRRTGD